MASATSSQPPEDQLLKNHEEQLVNALSKVDLLKFSDEMINYRCITREEVEAFNSLDCDRLDSGITVRYLLHLVREKAKKDHTIFISFIEKLIKDDSVGVALIGSTLDNQLRTAKQNPDSMCSEDDKLTEADIPHLTDILVEVSYDWDVIGLSLKLPPYVRKNCGKVKEEKDILRLEKVLAEWISGRSLHANPPTLKNLKEALASATVGQVSLAQNLQQKFENCKLKAYDLHSTKKPRLDIPFCILCQSNCTKVDEGKSTLLEVQVLPTEYVSYQWMKGGQCLSESSGFYGTQSPMLLIKQASQEVGGDYYCQVSYGSDMVTSNLITLKVICQDEYLATSYKKLEEIPKDLSPLVRPNTFTDLVLIKREKMEKSNHYVEDKMDRIIESKKKIAYKDAFSKYERGARVLVEGRPGSGKTTLTHKIIKDWAQGMALKHAYYVFLVPLRENQNESDLFGRFCQNHSETIANKLKMSGGDKVCFILDGYDEYTPQNKDTSIIHKLIHKEYLPDAMVIITSRPAAIAEFRNISTRIEILGFTEEKFKQYVKNYPFEEFSGEAGKKQRADLLSKLKVYSNVLNMCYLPFNANMICFLHCQDLGDDIPKTETQFFEQVVIAIISHKQSSEKRRELDSLKNLQGEDKECFSQVCSLAFDMTVEQKQNIHSTDIKAFRGLFTVDRTIILFTLRDEFTFLHLKLQEFLAAYHLAALDKDQQKKMIHLHRNKNHMLTTFKFFCGLADFKYKMHQFNEIDFKYKIHQFNEITKSIGPDCLYTIHCAFETQQEVICRKAMELIQGLVRLEPAVITPADFTALGYVLSSASDLVKMVNIGQCLLYEDSISEIWKNREPSDMNLLEYSFEYSAAEAVTSLKKCLDDVLMTRVSYHTTPQYFKAKEQFNEVLSKGLYHADPNKYADRAKEMMQSSDIFSSDSAAPLADALQKCSNLQYFDLLGNYSSPKSATVIANILMKCSQLETISLYGAMPSAVLANGLKFCIYLKEFKFGYNDLTSDGAAALAEGLACCTNLKTLKLLCCNIGAGGAVALACAISNMSLQHLDLQWNNIGPEGMQALSNNINFKTLQHLILPHNNISSGGVSVANQLRECAALEQLDLTNNNIDPDGVIALAEALISCTKLQALSLASNHIEAAGAKALANGLSNCSDLKILQFDSCNLCVAGLTALVLNFCNWKGLKVLVLSGNGMIVDGAAALIAGGLQECLLHLERLYLSNNKIDCDSAKTLAEGIQNCSHLHTLDLSNNKIGSHGVTALTGGLKCELMQLVNFSHNPIGPDSVASLVSLVKDTRPQRLDLSHNNIGEEGAKALIRELVSWDGQMKQTLPEEVQKNLKSSELNKIKINLSDNNISQGTAKYIKITIETCLILTVLLDDD